MSVIDLVRSIFFQKVANDKFLYEKLRRSMQDEKDSSKTVFVGELLKRAAENFSDKDMIIFKGKSFSYKEIYFRSTLLSKKLIDIGVRPRDRVIMCFENSPEFYIAYFSILQIGAICIPLNTFLHEKEISYILNDAKPSAVIVAGYIKSKFENIYDESLILSSEHIDFETDVPSKIDFTIKVLNDDELCLLLYTSGTTGIPKGVMLSSKNIITNTLQCSARLGALTKFTKTKTSAYETKERFYAALPLFHVFAQNVCIWFPLMIGGTIIVVPKIDRRDIMEGLMQNPTLFFGVPALFGLLCLLKTAPLYSVKFFVSGGDAMPDKIRTAFSLVYGRKICSGYGLTEASPVVAVTMDNIDMHTTVVGRPLHGIECQTRKDDAICETNKVGTLWVKGDNVMLGYYHAQEETDKVIQDGWLNTGDLAIIDDNENISIVGRSKDLIIHKGFNIYPQEVENVLLSHPEVFRAAVIGKEDMTCGQVPIAYIALKSDSINMDKKLRKFCIERLAVYKIPRKFVCLDDLPINATGKVDKKKLDMEIN